MASSVGLSKFYTRVVSQTGLKPSGSVLFLHGSGMNVEYILCRGRQMVIESLFTLYCETRS